MRMIFCGLTLAAGALLMSAGTFSVAIAAPPSAEQAQQEQPKQVALTQKQIDDLVAAQPDVQAAVGKDGPSDEKQQAALQSKIEAIAKKHGFADLAQMTAVSYSVGIVLAGIDQSKTYVGQTAVIQAQMKEIQADKKMPPKEKAEALKEMKEALKQGDGDKPMPANIELVKKNYDAIAKTMQSE